MMNIDFEKMNGLVPAIIQDSITKNVLMLGFMNEEAYQKTLATKRVHFTAVPANVFGQRVKQVEIISNL